MAERTLVQKLGIKPGHRLSVQNAPQGYTELLEPLPEGATLSETLKGQFDFILLYVRSVAEVEQFAPETLKAIKPDGLLWYAYPKKSGAIKTDINRDAGWDVVKRAGWDTVAAIAIDETWSALRFRPTDKINARLSK
jgi:hypothetical protein